MYSGCVVVIESTVIERSGYVEEVSRDLAKLASFLANAPPANVSSLPRATEESLLWELSRLFLQPHQSTLQPVSRESAVSSE